MNTIRKMKKNAKALSPVVASIILIAVTVAVSIAVAAWMGALVVGNMSTEELKITNVEFAADASDATLTIKNTGSSAVTIADVYIGSSSATADTQYDPGTGLVDIPADGVSVAANAILELVITPTGGFDSGQSYQFKVMTAKGNPFIYTATAPL